jgi:hypothetical protein
VAVELDVDRILSVVAESVRRQQCILFLGAGVHAPPPNGSAFEYPEEHRPPIGKALSRKLAQISGFAEKFPLEDADDLQRVALAFEVDCSRQELVEAVRTEVHQGKQPSPIVTALAELDFPLIITTNYDRLLERALVAAGKDPHVTVYEPDGDQPTADCPEPTAAEPVVFKIHGDVSHRETIVITDEDYINFVMRMSSKRPYDPVPMTIGYYLTRWTTLFVGYSLLDYNLRLLIKTLRWKVDRANMPAMYSVDYRPDRLVVAVWDEQQRYVKFIAEDAWAFVPKLHELVQGKELKP